MKQMIYADNAATTKLSNAAFEAMIPWLTEEYGNASQTYSFSRNPKKALLTARNTIANCIGALPEEIYFTSGGTESDNWAIKGTAWAGSRDRAIITSAFEHHAVLHACEAIEMQLYPVAFVWPDKNGIVTSEALNNIITDETYMVSIMFANNEIGTIQPIKELCDIAHSHGAIFHTDAVQAVGHIKIDVKSLGIDLLSASAHKFNGPKGIGFLYIRKGTKLFPFNDGGAQENGMRAGTENVAAIVGMATALEENCNSIEQNTEKIKKAEQALLERLTALGITFFRNGNKEHLPGLLSLSFPGADGETLLHRMDLKGISISTGSACDSVNTQISHVLRTICLDEILAKGTIRISLGRYNTIEDAKAIADAIASIIK